MVLQDLGETPSDSFNDSPYPSDNDPYSSTSTPSGRRYDASQLPQPMPILAPFMGFSESVIRFKTESTIKFAEKRVGRSLTPEEAQTLAFHLYRMEQTKSYFTFTGMTFGVKRWYDTMATYRFPLYQPKVEEINPNKFLFIRGPLAQYARHSWRFFLYAFCAGELGKLIGQLVAQPLAARDTAADPKLGQFAVDLKAAISIEQQQTRDGIQRTQTERERRLSEMQRREGNSPGGHLGRNADGSEVLPPHAGQPRWGRRAPPAASPAQDADDMSPTAGNDPWTPVGESAFSPEPTYAQQSQQPTHVPNRVNSHPSRPAEDDMSPTGGQFNDEVETRSQPGESAWERLRRGGPPPGRRAPPPRREDNPYGNVQRERKEGSTTGDGFAFESDEERKRAQREFDERIERERQGKDFDEERKW